MLQSLPREIRSRGVFLKEREPVKKFQRDYRQAVKDTELSDFTVHDLRHCAINNMRLAGNDSLSIMAQDDGCAQTAQLDLGYRTGKHEMVR